MSEAKTQPTSRVLSDGKQSGKFDVRSWQGLTAVLKASRDSGMNTDAYALFRDMVLRYAQSGGTDAALRQKIESAIATFHMPIVLSTSPQREEVTKKSEAETQEEKKAPFGGARPRPRFSPVAKVGEQDSRNVPSAAPHNLPISPVVPPEKESPSQVQESREEPVPVVIKKEVPLPVEKAIPDIPTPPPSVATSAPKTVEEYKARIDEIKHTVTAEIGNPTALLNETDAVGREYMTALVAAMKGAFGAAPGTLVSSMQKLEEVFPRVLKAAAEHRALQSAPIPQAEAPREVLEEEEHDEVVDITPAVTVPEAEIVFTEPERIVEETVPVVTPEPLPQMEAVAEVAPVRAPQVEEVAVPEPAPMPEAPPMPEPIPVPQVEEPLSSIASAYEASKAALEKFETPREVVAPAPEPEPEPEPISIPEPVTEETAAVEKISPIASLRDVNVPQTVTQTIPKSVPAPRYETATSSIEETADVPQTPFVPRKEIPIPPQREPVPPTKETRTLLDDLSTPQIDAGLEEILNTWSIFRGGGLFGIRKGGIAHPLYQKLKDAPMSVVATGRWDGAEREQILSMRDYISGWRHEQGLWYMPTETFETYLRRIVKRVLERQKR